MYLNRAKSTSVLSANKLSTLPLGTNYIGYGREPCANSFAKIMSFINLSKIADNLERETVVTEINQGGFSFKKLCTDPSGTSNESTRNEQLESSFSAKSGNATEESKG